MSKEIILSSGGQLERVENSKGKKVLEKIKFEAEKRNINMWINEDSLSYLTLQEALDMRDALNQVISDATGLTILLNGREHGFAVMNKELTAFSLEDISLDTCKRYCRKDCVVVKRIPYVCGFEIRVTWINDWYKPFDFKGILKNIFWLHWSINKIYLHKNGEIVYHGE